MSGYAESQSKYLAKRAAIQANIKRQRFFDDHQVGLCFKSFTKAEIQNLAHIHSLKTCDMKTLRVPLVITNHWMTRENYAYMGDIAESYCSTTGIDISTCQFYGLPYRYFVELVGRMLAVDRFVSFYYRSSNHYQRSGAILSYFVMSIVQINVLDQTPNVRGFALDIEPHDLFGKMTRIVDYILKFVESLYILINVDPTRVHPVLSRFACWSDYRAKLTETIEQTFTSIEGCIFLKMTISTVFPTQYDAFLKMYNLNTETRLINLNLPAILNEVMYVDVHNCCSLKYPGGTENYSCVGEYYDAVNISRSEFGMNPYTM
jgi:hypothetical protein